MEANVSLDLGKNVTELLTKLATSLGTTVEKMYPFYVKQVQAEAVVNIVVLCVIFMVSLVSLVYSDKNIKSWLDKDFTKDNAVYMCSLVVIAITTIIGVTTLASWVTAIMNPEYAALRLIIADCGKLLGK